MFPGFFLALPLSRLYHRLGADQSRRSRRSCPRSRPRCRCRPGSRSFQSGLYGATCSPAFLRRRSRRQGRCGLEADGAASATAVLLKNLGYALVPLVLTVARCGLDLVVRRDPPAGEAPPPPLQLGRRRPRRASSAAASRNVGAKPNRKCLQQMGSAELPPRSLRACRRMPGRRRSSTSGSPVIVRDPRLAGAALLPGRMGAEQFEVLQAADHVGDAARHPHRRGARGDPVRHHDGDGIGGGRCRRRLPARVPGPHARLEAHQGGGVPDGQDHLDGVLAVRRLGAVLRRCSPSSAARRCWRAGCCR
jgi:hypothetical protein